MSRTAYTVFISHAGQDIDVARLLSGNLEAVGVKYVLDAHHIDGGADFCDWMCEQVGSCQELLLLLSPAALDSPNVVFELGVATAHGLWITPILYRMDVKQLKRTKLGQSILARTSVLTLERFDEYKTQLKSRMGDFDSQSETRDDSRALSEISKILARARLQRPQS